MEKIQIPCRKRHEHPKCWYITTLTMLEYTLTMLSRGKVSSIMQSHFLKAHVYVYTWNSYEFWPFLSESWENYTSFLFLYLPAFTLFHNWEKLIYSKRKNPHKNLSGTVYIFSLKTYAHKWTTKLCFLTRDIT